MSSRVARIRAALMWTFCRFRRISSLTIRHSRIARSARRINESSCIGTGKHDTSYRSYHYQNRWAPVGKSER